MGPAQRAALRPSTTSTRRSRCAKLDRGDSEYLSPELIPRFDLYLSFTGGPTLRRLERIRRAAGARALLLRSIRELYLRPASRALGPGLLGTYSDDRQPTLERLLIEPARLLPGGRFVVAGPQYPDSIEWPANVDRIEHLPPAEHAQFYSRQRFTLNITRADMIAAGWSPSVRLFEAAACGTPIISDAWDGIEMFLRPGSEMLRVHDTADVLAALDAPAARRDAIARAARACKLRSHTAETRAGELERHLLEAAARRRLDVAAAD